MMKKLKRALKSSNPVLSSAFVHEALNYFFAVFMFATQAQNIVPILNDAKIKAKATTQPMAYAFAPEQVRLLDEPFKKAMELDAAYLLEIEPDRLLHRFHKFAGLPTKGDIYGGWEKETLSGHTLGYYLSACTIHYAPKFIHTTAFIQTGGLL